MSDLPVAPGSYPDNATNTLGPTDEYSEVGYFLRRTPGRAARLASDIHRLRISVLLYGDRVQPPEAQPLTSRALLLLMPESTISLITVIAGVARAINILAN